MTAPRRTLSHRRTWPDGGHAFDLFDERGNVLASRTFLGYPAREAERLFRELTGTVGVRLR